jgi:hypothetical protein
MNSDRFPAQNLTDNAAVMETALLRSFRVERAVLFVERDVLGARILSERVRRSFPHVGLNHNP